jgi:hypothetical protein
MERLPGRRTARDGPFNRFIAWSRFIVAAIQAAGSWLRHNFTIARRGRSILATFL